MPVSRNDLKRKRRECDNIVDCLPDSPKRTKVHAQRKFAQGSALCNTIITTPIKEIDKPKPVDVTPTELLPSKRPNTEDFLTFLCFRGTSILPPTLDFFNAASHADFVEENSKDDSVDKSEAESEKPVNQPPGRPFVAFGVRKRADPYPDTKIDRKRRHAMTVQALRRKYQDQRLAKVRAIAANMVGVTGTSTTTKMSTRTRSSVREIPAIGAVKKNAIVVSKRKIIVKRKMRLRSGGRIIRTEIVIPAKRPVPKNKPEKLENSSEFSSDDDQPLVKTVTKLKPKTLQLRMARKTATIITKGTTQKKSVIIKRKTIVSQRKTRSNSILKPASGSQRPTRKTKEAAALYMELLGRKLVNEAEIDDDTLSIDSFPELPNVRKAEQRENEFKARSKTACRMNTRSSIDSANVIKSNPGNSKSGTETRPRVKVSPVIRAKTQEQKINIETRKDSKELRSQVKNRGIETRKSITKELTITTRTKSAESVKENSVKESVKKEQINKTKGKEENEYKTKESAKDVIKVESKDSKIKTHVVVRHTRQSAPKLDEEKSELKEKVVKKSVVPAKNKIGNKVNDSNPASNSELENLGSKNDKLDKNDKNLKSEKVVNKPDTKTAQKQDKTISKIIPKTDKTSKSTNSKGEIKSDNTSNKSDVKLDKNTEKDSSVSKNDKNVKIESTSNKIEKSTKADNPVSKSEKGINKLDKNIKTISTGKSEVISPKADVSTKLDKNLSKTDKIVSKQQSADFKLDKPVIKSEKPVLKSDKKAIKPEQSTSKVDVITSKIESNNMKPEPTSDSKENPKLRTKLKLELSFSDSDEEPLACKIKAETESSKSQKKLGLKPKSKLVSSSKKASPERVKSPQLTDKSNLPVKQSTVSPKSTVLANKSISPVPSPKLRISPDKSVIGCTKTSILAKLTTTTSKLAISSSKSNISLAKSNVPPVKLNAVLVKSNIVPVKSNPPPVKLNVPPVKSSVPLVKSNVLPVKSNIAVVKSNALPSKSNVAPAKSNVVAVKSNVVPVKSNITQQKIAATATKSISSTKSISAAKSTASTAKSSISKSLMVSSVDAVKVESDVKAESGFPLSDDDEEKVFRGFVKSESHKKSCISHQNIACHSGSIDIKDIGRRFGKGKVNMSNEQIEKWLNDADQELKKESIKKQTEIFEEKSVNFTTDEIKSEDIEKEEPKVELEAAGIPQFEKKSIFQQRRPIIMKSKERKEIVPNANAFSPDNESSVYAFEADSDSLPVSTPFRRHNRRSSSTATSKSEDEAVKIDDDVKKFRLPAIYKPNTAKSGPNEQQVSLTLTSDDGTNRCTSIAVQVNLDTSEQVALDSNLECSTQADNDGGHLFYIPLQTNSESSSDQQVIQGVAVKLGTAGPNGPNQRVIMQAKLVTKATTNQGNLPVARTILPSQQSRTSTSMYPPVGTVQPFRSKPSEMVKPMARTVSEHSTSSDDTKFDKYKSIPTSPSASSSSSSKINKRPTKLKPRVLETCLPLNITKFPNSSEPSKMVEAPVFYPSEREFQDPLEYIDKIRPLAESFGLCRIVPPAGFKPECKVSDDMRFTAYNQYVHKMLHRWGPNFRELTAIKKYLATQNITLCQAPWIGGMEIDLPRLYQTVQSLGGLKEVIEKKRWPRVAEIMRIPKSAQDRLTKLDDIYCKYLLPYDTLSPAEREKLLKDVDTDWEKRNKRNTPRDSSSEDAELESDDVEMTECIVRGRGMPLNSFYRIARNTMAMWFKNPEPTVTEVETEFWKHVKTRTHHLCVNSGSIDSSGYGYGFVCSKNSPFARHPWNLKVLTNNSNSILRSMGPIMGVTVPTLHVGMVFSACCWYRDPHCLPWIEYLHTGANKVWYGIPDTYHSAFRKTLNEIVPRLCRKTSVWLPSDTAMIPPSILVGNNVSLCRTVQEPGQYIIIFPKAFTSSLCTGYTVSESVFFARSSWLDEAETIFKELRESSEPSMFSLERLLLSIATDTRCSLDVCKKILPGVRNIIEKERADRERLAHLGLVAEERLPQSNKKKKKADTDGEYLCEVCRSNLYVSLVAEAQDDGVYCLQHAAEYLETEKIMTKNCKLMYTYTESELSEIVDKLVNSIDTKSLKKSGK